ncbi:MAG: hypothetical protein EPO30_03555 [Lysobacteraceae bacterium]|nr:MAG: hypothetical protein EPO30_03555 [Xanthomonadaceae bacterium]
MAHSAERRARWLAPALLALGIAGCAAAWILLSIASGRQSSWMALVAGLDAALLLRLAGVQRGPGRILAATAATFATIAAASWGIAASQMGRSIGVLPWISAYKLGPEFAWTLLGLANTPADWAWLAAGLVVGAVAAR